MFHNPHTIRAIVPIVTLAERTHKQVRKEDEVVVFWPCFYDEMVKTTRTADGEFHQLDAKINLNVVPDVAEKFGKGIYLRFEHDKNHYYKVFDFTKAEGLFGENAVFDARLVRIEQGLRPTGKRTNLDTEVDEVIVVLSDEDAVPPGKHRRRWGY